MTLSLSEILNGKQPVVMGILNTTPDSFSDGGRYTQVETAVQHALQMQAEGALMIDIGGESTRPGAQSVSVEDEINRVVPVIERLRQQSDIFISIDTSKPEVMRAAVNAGANLINDVNGLRAPGVLEACAELGVPVCIMHMQGEPRSMQNKPEYTSVVDDIHQFLQQRVEDCVASGIRRDNILLDPGFGFGKNLQHNLQLLKQLDAFNDLQLPVLVGLSRKSMFASILDGAPVEERLHASIAAAVISCMKGAKVFRVHDVKPTLDALKVCTAVDSA